jgi:hypothetical protein
MKNTVIIFLSIYLQALTRDGEHQYTAFVCLAVARCHQAMKNTSLEALYLTNAGMFIADLSVIDTWDTL